MIVENDSTSSASSSAAGDAGSTVWPSDSKQARRVFGGRDACGIGRRDRGRGFGANADAQRSRVD